MSDKMFDIDPANKLGNADWGEDDDFTSFVAALNSGSTVRRNGLPGMAESTDDFSLDAAALIELKSKLGNYR